MSVTAVITPEAVAFGDQPTMSLDRLAIGKSATIVGVIGERAIRRRLLEMGLCRDIEVTAIRRAPLGDPIEFRVRGYYLSLRAEQALHVIVRAKV
jgi:Fe2+ transport system protein FeoA